MDKLIPFRYPGLDEHDSFRPKFSLLSLLLAMTIVGPTARVLYDAPLDFFMATGLSISFVSSAALVAWIVSFLTPLRVGIMLAGFLLLAFITYISFVSAIPLRNGIRPIIFVLAGFSAWGICMSICALGLSWSL